MQVDSPPLLSPHPSMVSDTPSLCFTPIRSQSPCSDSSEVVSETSTESLDNSSGNQDLPSDPCESVLLPTSESIATLNESSDNQRMSVNAGFKLVFDNIDKTVQPRHMRVDSKAKSLHYVHAYAIKDRIDFSCEPEKKDGEANLYDILPNSQDYKLLKENFSVHVSRIIVAYMDFFRDDFKDLPLKHIPHKFSKEMSMKSEVVRNYL